MFVPSCHQIYLVSRVWQRRSWKADLTALHNCCSGLTSCGIQVDELYALEESYLDELRCASTARLAYELSSLLLLHLLCTCRPLARGV